MIKKLEVITLILILILGFHFTVLYNNTYCMRGVVTSVEGGTTVLEDDTGNVWLMTNTGLKKGDTVRIRFDKSGTDMNREDDIIIGVRVA